jgi:hypothetical protein
MKSHRSASGNCIECVGQRLRADDMGYNAHALILHGRLLFTLCFQLCTLTVQRRCLT